MTAAGGALPRLAVPTGARWRHNDGVLRRLRPGTPSAPSAPVPPDDPALATLVSALVREAGRRAAAGWVTVPGQPARAVWLTWVDPTPVLLVGPQEQDVPGLAAAVAAGTPVQLTLRAADSGARLVRAEVLATRVGPQDPDWPPVLAALVKARLNAPDADAAPQRWAQQCLVLRLTATGVAGEDPRAPATASGAAAARPSPARTPVPQPFVLGPRRRR